MILTDDKGRPFERPEPPAADAPPQEFTAWLRAVAEYTDRVTDAANRAFDRALAKGFRCDR